MFGLFYGLYGYYWHQFLAEQRSPVFMYILQDNGYSFKIISAAPLTFPQFRKTIFVNIPSENIHDSMPGKNRWRRELNLPKLAKDLIIKEEYKEPFFCFIFMNASHFGYIAPEKHWKYKPVHYEINGITRSMG